MKTFFLKTCIAALLMTTLVACSKEEDTADNQSSGTYKTVTIGIFTENNGTYTATGKELIYNSEGACQTWSRTAPADAHNAAEHLHYNAATDVSLNSSHTSFSWTEFGPEIDQSAIEATCAAGSGGVRKTANTTSYVQDKNFYLKITKVE